MAVEAIVEAVKKTISLCDKVVESSDSEKFIKSVQELNASTEETFAEMRKTISEDQTLSTDEKLKRLGELADKQIAARQTCEEAIKDNKSNSSNVVGSVLLAISTGGVSLGVSGIIKKIQKDKTKKSNLKLTNTKQ